MMFAREFMLDGPCFSQVSQPPRQVSPPPTNEISQIAMEALAPASYPPSLSSRVTVQATQTNDIASKIEKRIESLKVEEERAKKLKREAEFKEVQNNLDKNGSWPLWDVQKLIRLSPPEAASYIESSPHFRVLVEGLCSANDIQSIDVLIAHGKRGREIQEILIKNASYSVKICQKDPSALKVKHQFLNHYSYAELEASKAKLSCMQEVKRFYENQEFEKIAEVYRKCPEVKLYLIRLFLQGIKNEKYSSDPRAIFIRLQEAGLLTADEFVRLFSESMSRNGPLKFLRSSEPRRLFQPIFKEISDQGKLKQALLIDLTHDFSAVISSWELFDKSPSYEIDALKRANFYELGFRLWSAVDKSDFETYERLVREHSSTLDYVHYSGRAIISKVMDRFFSTGEVKWISTLLGSRRDLQQKVSAALGDFLKGYKPTKLAPCEAVALLTKWGVTPPPDEVVRSAESCYQCSRLAKLLSSRDQFLEKFRKVAHAVMIESSELQPIIEKLPEFTPDELKVVLEARPDLKPHFYVSFFDRIQDSYWLRCQGDSYDVREIYYSMEKNGLIDVVPFISALFRTDNWNYRVQESNVHMQDIALKNSFRMALIFTELCALHEISPEQLISYVPLTFRKSQTFFDFFGYKGELLRRTLGLTKEAYKQALAANKGDSGCVVS